MQEARRAREEGERRKRERGYDRRYRDRDRYRRVCILICIYILSFTSIFFSDFSFGIPVGFDLINSGLQLALCFI